MKKRVVLVTGGTGALGRAVTAWFLKAGDVVCVPFRDAERFAALQAEAVAADRGEQLFGYECLNLSEGTAVQACIDQIETQHGQVDILVNCVGLTRFSPFEKLDPDLWQTMLAGNLAPIYHTLRRVFSGMVARKYGRIINITSWKAQRGEAGLAAYSATKSAINRLTESVAAEIPADPDVDVTANVLLPAKLNTQRNRSLLPNANPQEWIQLADVAELIGFLCTGAGRAINGACIPVYGKLFGRESSAPLMLGR